MREVTARHPVASQTVTVPFLPGVGTGTNDQSCRPPLRARFDDVGRCLAAVAAFDGAAGVAGSARDELRNSPMAVSSVCQSEGSDNEQRERLAWRHGEG